MKGDPMSRDPEPPLTGTILVAYHVVTGQSDDVPTGWTLIEPPEDTRPPEDRLREADFERHMAFTCDCLTWEEHQDRALAASRPAPAESPVADLLERLVREAHGKGYTDSPHVRYVNRDEGQGGGSWERFEFETCSAPDCVAVRAALREARRG